MNQEKIGKLIKELRKKNNLTQKEFANKYGVTYQAVSKWENGKNMPDVSLIKEMSKDFNINLEDILEGELKSKPKQKNILKITIVLITIIIILLGIILILFKNRDENFEFKTLSTECNYFNISGSIAYNKNKSSIYISNIHYCGGEDNTLYEDIECVLYESNKNIETRIDEVKYNKKEPIKLEDFLKDVKFNIDNYRRTCEQYKNNSLFLEINATDKYNKVTTYKVPLTIEETCFK